MPTFGTAARRPMTRPTQSFHVPRVSLRQRDGRCTWHVSKPQNKK